jgi:hypothetical protein
MYLEILPDIEKLSFVAGIILLFVALIGGGFKIKEIEMPRVKGIFRFLSAIFGLLLMGIGINNMIEPKKIKPNPADTIVEIIQPEIHCADCKVWNLIWLSNNTQYEALLVFNPTKGYGKMRVKYFSEGKIIIVQEEMNQKSTVRGQFLAGQNPFNTETFQPITSYIPDNIIMNGDSIWVFDQNGTYETRAIPINDVQALYQVFGFSYLDLDF